MKYYIDFQHMPKGSSRPTDDGEIVGIEAGEDTFALLPQVGDYVHVDNSTDEQGRGSLTGRVKSRLFMYARETCTVNVVVEETDDDFGALIKQ